ncbi:putative TOS1-like glycosyl hydrolase-domain-containing protein [Lipomyces oligophaga]|uniref:putative TOS1-like glycosyl hydrolase-domain-containing protein n=1 Tax=Lipomyces oligophaga TaxID=45792 RepID=UPI0034CF0632
MRSSLYALVSLIAAASVAADCQEISGNYYCNEVSAIEFANVGFSGSYDDVTNMSDDCTCSTSTKSFSGPIAPLSEDISMHFRGPLQLKQLSVYTSSSSSSSAKLKKRDPTSPGPAAQPLHQAHKRDPHVHAQQHGVLHQKRAVEYVTQIVTMIETVFYNPDEDSTASEEPSASTIETQSSDSAILAVIATPVEVTVSGTSPSTFVSSTTTSYPADTSPLSSTTSESSTSDSLPTSTSSSDVVETVSSSSSTTSTSSTTSSAASSSSTVISTSDWSRVGQYDASSGTMSGLVFLNNMGGSNGSGTWDTCWGSSLSFANSDGLTGAAESQVLADTLIPSDYEVIVFSDTECTTDTCGYYREDSTAYLGFSGDMKMFLIEFQMPTDSDSTADANVDMPAIWFLNGRIPRTQQYGSCSCWQSGCGEFDAFEVLSTGSSYMTCTLHDWQGTGTQYGGGGSSDYFGRPTDATMKAAVIFDGADEQIFLVKLDDSTDFSDAIDASTIADWMSADATVVTIAS